MEPQMDAVHQRGSQPPLTLQGRPYSGPTLVLALPATSTTPNPGQHHPGKRKDRRLATVGGACTALVVASLVAGIAVAVAVAVGLTAGTTVVGGAAGIAEEDAEEADQVSGTCESGFTWIIDPIDGTKEFIAQRADFCIMLGLCYKNEPVYGVIDIPLTNEIFYGGGHFGVTYKKNGDELELPVERLMSDKVMVSRSHNRGIVDPYIIDRGMTAVACGSAGVKVCRLIDGSAGHYVHATNVHEWDTAAADALIRGAGGYLCDFTGREVVYGKPGAEVAGVIASFDKERIEDIANYFSGR